MAAVPLMGRTLHTQINYAQIHTNYRKTHIRKEKDTQTETYIENCDSGTQPLTVYYNLISIQKVNRCIRKNTLKMSA